jgi:hypothetical protein
MSGGFWKIWFISGLGSLLGKAGMMSPGQGSGGGSGLLGLLGKGKNCV